MGGAQFHAALGPAAVTLNARRAFATVAASIQGPATMMAKLQARDAKARATRRMGRDFSEALSRGIDVILAFAPEGGALTLSDVARRLGLPRATVRRALLTLVELGYAVEAGRQFSLTPKILQFAGAYLGVNHAAKILQPQCERLSLEYNETFSVAALDGEDAVMVAYATPRRLYLDARGIGLRLPAFCSAVGRVLLAGLPEAERESFIDRLVPRPVTPHTVTDKVQLRKILARVASTGFAMAEAEAEVGFRSLAVPVRRASGAVVYALNVGMPVERCSAKVMQSTHLARLLSEAEGLGRLLL
jgi:IclR family pca regulon transcriptional regulator